MRKWLAKWLERIGSGILFAALVIGRWLRGDKRKPYI